MNYPKKTKRITLALTLVFMVLSLSVGYLFLEVQLKLSINQQFQDRYESVRKLFEINIERERQKYALELEKIIALEGVSEAVAANNHDKLLLAVSKYYASLKSFNEEMKILTFRSKDNITILRAHKPEFYGDTLSEKRKLITDTAKLQKSQSGFEVGKLEATYRVVEPIFYKDEYVGNVEVGLSPTHFINDLNEVFNIHSGVAVDKALTDIMLDTGKAPSYKNYMLFSNSETLNYHFAKHMDLKEAYFELGDPFKVKMEIPLYNHLLEKIAYLVVGFDTSEIVKNDKSFVKKFFILMALMMIILGYVLHKGFEKMLVHFTKQLYTDELTGLKNRAALNAQLFSKTSHALILSDIKEFSIINEIYGVEAGNEVLIQVAKAFKEFARKHNLKAFRVSSDEYVLLREETIFETQEYNDILEELHNQIKLLDIYVDNIKDPINIDIHSGVALGYEHSLEEAHMALKNAKQGSLPYLAYSQQIDTKEKSEEIVNTKRIIKHALEHQNVIPFFQQITDVEGKIVKYEALIRILEFENGKKTVLSPNAFLEVSKHNALYVEIAKRMIQQSLSLFSKRNEKISINLYPTDLFNPFIVDTLLEHIKKFDSPKRIVVEITEQEGIMDFERLTRLIRMLRDFGVLIAIDDFGSGYANYAHILKLKPDYIKIDGSLIEDILTNKESQILVKSIISFAKDLNVTTIAEYVKNKEIFELLKEYGIDEYQGYYFGQPEDLIHQED
ncbi:EAL domain-containing protein [bacterium]|nr:EAL domain-containing protein [bacterium]MBU1990804.1 EAL domain-containing protein [bacterium]